MLLMGRHTGWLAGMPMGTAMLIGMGVIMLGGAAAAYGLFPRRSARHADYGSILPPEDALLTKAHLIQIAVLAVALVIDVMKASSLGFVIPGMRVEYGLNAAQVAILPVFALLGTTIGSLIWGALADIYGRRASLLLAALFFVGTSICGAMPSFAWNVFMCVMMGLAAGGMLPVANALLAEIMPTRHRGWCLVLIGGVGTIGGYFATSASSALLQPYFGWRIMWWIGFPTGLMLIALSPLLPESARFLLEMGRIDEARETLARYGGRIAAAGRPNQLQPAAQNPSRSSGSPLRWRSPLSPGVLRISGCCCGCRARSSPKAAASASRARSSPDPLSSRYPLSPPSPISTASGAPSVS